ncbi:MAG: LysM peptidoglycan-binding domain-containing protein, partial [Chloroflexi bacterium]|nr:LysM peptidoglycan-binding domain-containing protein [Chloroflexota bacterium]
PIPYRSQWDADAQTHSADCGPTCMAMILNYHGKDISPDGVYAHLPPKEKDEFTLFHEMIKGVRKNNVGTAYKKYDNRNQGLTGLRANINAGKPMIALVKYSPWREATGNKFDWGHFVVVTGYDDAHIYVNDPLFGLWRSRFRGKDLKLTHDLFCAGWGGFNPNNNPNWACAVVDAVGDETAVVESAPPPPPPKPITPKPSTSANTMDDVNRRIRALAAYRWAEEPNFNDPAALKPWQDNLGDWGLTYDKYKVQSGDRLSGLAARHYDGQHRWYAIKAYNNMTRDGLWVGETILIPNNGQSGADTTDALPRDTTNFSKSLSFENLIDPDMAALDYNALGANSVGMGFMPTDNE